MPDGTQHPRGRIVRFFRRYRNARNGDIGPGGAGCQRWVSARYALDGDVNGARRRRGSGRRSQILDRALIFCGVALAWSCALGAIVVAGMLGGLFVAGAVIGWNGADDA